MMRKLIRVVAVLLVVGILASVGTGCASQAPATPPPEEPAGEEGPGGETIPPEAPEEPAPGEEAPSLAGVLEKAQGISSYSCDIEVTMPQEEPITAKTWWKGDKARWEGNFGGEEEVVMLMDRGAQQVLMYMPAEGMAFRMDYSSAEETVGETPQAQIEEMMEYQPEIIGTEVIDGKECLVATYSKAEEQVKIWVWVEHGLPIRTEITTAEGTTVMKLTNIQIGGVDDSIFELPDEVEIMDMPGM
jgi:outer membrane lipoprotein-sorting protein